MSPRLSINLPKNVFGIEIRETDEPISDIEIAEAINPSHDHQIKNQID